MATGVVWKWKPMEECPQFKYGMLHSYLRLSQSLEKCDDSISMSIDDTRNNLKAFIQQVLATRGYELDERPSEFPVPLDTVLRIKLQSEKMKEIVEFVVSSINAEAGVQKRDERYEFHQLEKVVEARLHTWYFLVTFSVREAAVDCDRLKTVQAMVHNPLYSTYHLQEWRFKPDEEATARPFKPPRPMTPDPSAMAGCELPPAIITRIISFLPSKKMSDCKLVCQAWRNLMTKEFYGTCYQLRLARKQRTFGE